MREPRSDERCDDERFAHAGSLATRAGEFKCSCAPARMWSDIAAIYTFQLFGFTELGESKSAIIIAAVLWIAIMTWVCYRGIELSARIQQVLLGAEVFILGLFAVVAFVKVFGSSPPSASIKPSLS